MQKYFILELCFYFLPYFFYLAVSHGLGHKAEYLQLRRFIPCALLAVLPLYLFSIEPTYPPYLLSIIIGAAWIITYPLLYFLTNRKHSSDFGFHLDIVFGLYIIGWLGSLKLLLLYFGLYSLPALIILSIIEFAILMIPLLQWCYYGIYHLCVDEGSIALLFSTYKKEVIEFYQSMTLFIQIFIPIIFISAFAAIVYLNTFTTTFPAINKYLLALAAIEFIFLTMYLWKKKKGVFIRTGIIELFLDVKNYLKETMRYTEQKEKRTANLKSKVNVKESQPHTFIMVIGESAARDYMSAFTTYPENTTPWMKSISQTKNAFVFPHAYSCYCQTVPSLERALTEVNQYNSKKFYASCSIVDIAKKAGYHTYWFSNQSYIGSADTPVTLVAHTADTSAWVKHNREHEQYDGSLLEYLKTVNPNQNNFVVLHLKGSHFNYINRYPQEFAKFSKPHKYDLVPNYLDSIAYTDYVLKQITEYAQENLNLQALIYFSDHGVTPDQRRSPKFFGFAGLRIPLFTYFSDNYIQHHPQVYETLKKHRQTYWTNDLAYELVCGILDVESNHYHPENSLAAEDYQFTREMLLTNLGETYIKDDLTEA